MTYAKVSTDDVNGKVKVYVGEGNFTDDPMNTAGGVAICQVENLQGLMDYMCRNGFEHHVAMNRQHSAKVLEEALGKYMGWDVYNHKV
jgi:L-fucose isomerase-like protein